MRWSLSAVVFWSAFQSLTLEVLLTRIYSATIGFHYAFLIKRKEPGRILATMSIHLLGDNMDHFNEILPEDGRFSLREISLGLSANSMPKETMITSGTPTVPNTRRKSECVAYMAYDPSPMTAPYLRKLGGFATTAAKPKVTSG